MFLQKDYEGLKAGTLMVEAKPTTAHLQAKAMLRGDVEPTGYWALPGQPDEVYAIPRFKMLLDERHPEDPYFKCPGTYNSITYGVDKLTEDFMIVLDKHQYPLINIQVVMDTDYFNNLVTDPDVNMTEIHKKLSLLIMDNKVLAAPKPKEMVNILIDQITNCIMNEVD